MYEIENLENYGESDIYRFFSKRYMYQMTLHRELDFILGEGTLEHFHKTLYADKDYKPEIKIPTKNEEVPPVDGGNYVEAVFLPFIGRVKFFKSKALKPMSLLIIERH